MKHRPIETGRGVLENEAMDWETKQFWDYIFWIIGLIAGIVVALPQGAHIYSLMLDFVSPKYKPLVIALLTIVAWIKARWNMKQVPPMPIYRP